MTTVWITVGVLAVATAIIRASGPVILGGHELHPRLMDVISLLAPALLAALVVVETFGGPNQTLELDARAAGLAAAAGVLYVRDSMLLAVFAAGLTAALVRALF